MAYRYTFLVLLTAACLGGVRSGAAPAAAPSDHVVEWTGRAIAQQHILWRSGTFLADDFSFTLDSPEHGTWQVVSRSPVPLDRWRLGPTYVGANVDWATNPQVRLLALRGVDRSPATYPDIKLDPERTLTALILEVRDGDGWTPCYVNNYFHSWGSAAENARVAQRFVGKGRPFDVYGTRGETLFPLTPAGQKLMSEFPHWRAYHGFLVRDPSRPEGYALEVRHLIVQDPNTAAMRVGFGDEADLPLLIRPGVGVVPVIP